MSNPINKTMTIQSVQPATGQAKSHKVRFLDPDDKFADSVQAYASTRDWQQDDFTEGDERTATLEWVPDKQDSTKGFYSVKKWGDKEAGKGGFKGAAGKSFVPKSPGAESLMAVSSVTNATGAVVGKMTEFGLLKKPEEVYEALRHVSEALTQEAVDATNKIKGAVA